MEKIVVYWAAPCFTQAERIWNRLCAKELENTGRYLVILPQDEAKNFIRPDEEPDFRGLAENCFHQALSSNIMVAILDGPDPDSGMSMESGFRISWQQNNYVQG